jgi:hypothetical protein
MRIIGTIVLAAVLGIFAGGALAYIENWSDPDAADKLVGPVGPDGRPLADKDGPRIEVTEAHYDFGSMQRGTSKSHEFTIRNVGKAPLKLRNGGTTCKCTAFKVPDDALQPGQSTTVKLEWAAKVDNGEFRQTATLLTNDPLQSQVDLVVSGQILAISGVEPPDFLFDKISVGERKSARVYVMAMLQDHLTVKDPLLSDPTVRDKFDVKIEPVDRKELPNKNAKRGVRITLTSKPGLPVGRINCWLSLHTDLLDAEKLEIPLTGDVVGDISINGNVGWLEGQGVLVIGGVKSSEGGHGKVNIIARGPEATKITFGVKSKDPEELKVVLGQPRKLSDTLVQVPVDIIIPPGTRPMVRLDTAQGDAGRIVFSTTHSAIKEVSLPVRFAVER